MIGFILSIIAEEIEADVLEKVKKIKLGDTQLLNDFIKEYSPFIKRTVSITTGNWSDSDESEEFSIGLMAFNEAIKCFDPEKYPKFLCFSRHIIKRRLIDHLRKNIAVKSIPFSSIDTDENEISSQSFEEKYLKSDSYKQFENIESIEEINAFIKKLSTFGISIRDLALSSPKHKDSMKLAVKIARILARNEELYQSLERKKTIPMKELLKLVDVHIRTVEKNRKFIIGVCLILRSNLDVLKGYAHVLEKEGVRNA